ncbi:HAD family hydrolase [Clostridium intestinale]|uniref:HAD family hydrolase n=1 Tax=Clostridium intestinale TaxID=36845 RepID=UPI0003F9A132
MQQIDSIIFDLDGTLWDSLETCLKAWEKALNDFGYIKEPITAEDLRGVFGLQHDLIGENYFLIYQKSREKKS